MEFAIAPEAETALLPTFLLQPLVENAVLHGIGGRIGAGLLRIEAKRQGGELVITVEDDGAGFPEGWTVEHSTGVGLRNVRSRLQLLYAAAGRLEFFARAGGGTAARITIPFQYAGLLRSSDSPSPDALRQRRRQAKGWQPETAAV